MTTQQTAFGEAAAPQRYVCIDFEFPNNFSPKISAYGLSVVEDGEITEERYSLINPHTHFDKRIIEITGITADMVAGKPSFPKIWKEISPLLKDAVLVAHGAGNDLRMLGRVLKNYDLPWKTHVPFLCTYDLSKAFYPELEKYGLANLCEHFGIPLDNHNALSDAHGCAALLTHYIRQGRDVDAHIREYDLVELMICGQPTRRQQIMQKKARRAEKVSAQVEKDLSAMATPEDLLNRRSSCGTFDRERVLGVHPKQIEQYAHTVRARNQTEVFMEMLPHTYYEENLLHAALLTLRTNYEPTLQQIDLFLPYVSSYETAMAIRPRVFRKRPEDTAIFLQQQLLCANKYALRFLIDSVIEFLPQTPYYLDFFAPIAAIRARDEYIITSQAKYFSVAIRRYPDNVRALLEDTPISQEIRERMSMNARRFLEENEKAVVVN
ncbi:MAG: hypothetical protein IJK02_01410 [Clostridia bacterium]|nr:hypothetical protein [Clostridia bacterium]MBR0538014.1 hypothetical protein [Clostridia bacterium]